MYEIQRFRLASTGSFINLFRRFSKSFEVPFCQCSYALVLCSAAAALAVARMSASLSKCQQTEGQPRKCCPATARDKYIRLRLVHRDFPKIYKSYRISKSY